jgi:hypothetical protein
MRAILVFMSTKYEGKLDTLVDTAGTQHCTPGAWQLSAKPPMLTPSEDGQGASVKFTVPPRTELILASPGDFERWMGSALWRALSEAFSTKDLKSLVSAIQGLSALFLQSPSPLFSLRNFLMEAGIDDTQSLERYERILKENKVVKESDLQFLTEKRLKEWGISAGVDCAKIATHARKLKR